ncbi:hypothetical protein HK104_007128, partial [Borealophlyctis nickersoniae]
MDVEIVGSADAVERARMKCLVLFDEMSGLYHISLEVDPKLHLVIAGRKRVLLEALMYDTMTNIYLPSPFVGMHVTYRGQPAGDTIDDGSGGDRYPFTIHITGQQSGVLQARERLIAMAFNRKPHTTTRPILSHPRKLDWMLINRKDALRKIMTDNACFVGIPVLGSGSNILSVTGDDPVYIERAIRAVNLMWCEFYAAAIELNPPRASPSSSPPPLTPLPPLSQINTYLGPICASSRAEIVFTHNLFEIYGVEPAVKAAYTRTVDLEFLRMSPTLLPATNPWSSPPHASHSHSSSSSGPPAGWGAGVRTTKIQLELGLEHREFINGKKSGKVNKIIKASGSDVKFETRYNDYNMLIDLWNSVPGKALEGLQLLEDELPAELSFYVPETYHKRIIGVGGKNIQRIMKKHGVYVKFSNADEHAALGGYFENEDNVIARTPAKNAANLENLKASVMEMVN